MFKRTKKPLTISDADVTEEASSLDADEKMLFRTKKKKRHSKSAVRAELFAWGVILIPLIYLIKIYLQISKSFSFSFYASLPHK